jgi:hypothetical protein
VAELRLSARPQAGVRVFIVRGSDRWGPVLCATSSSLGSRARAHSGQASEVVRAKRCGNRKVFVAALRTLSFSTGAGAHPAGESTRLRGGVTAGRERDRGQGTIVGEYFGMGQSRSPSEASSRPYSCSKASSRHPAGRPAARSPAPDARMGVHPGMVPGRPGPGSDGVLAARRPLLHQRADRPPRRARPTGPPCRAPRARPAARPAARRPPVVGRRDR